jgi:protoporphyrinogen oxidase
MPWLAPDGWSIVTADLGCAVGDCRWNAPDDQLAERCLERLEQVVPDVRQRYDGCRVVRTPVAYPIYLREYESERQRLAQGTGVAGLISVGRNGEFRHLLMEDVYWRTRWALRGLIAGRVTPSLPIGAGRS